MSASQRNVLSEMHLQNENRQANLSGQVRFFAGLPERTAKQFRQGERKDACVNAPAQSMVVKEKKFLFACHFRKKYDILYM